MIAQSGKIDRWFLWIRRKDITDGQGVLYLRRWILFSFFGYKLMLHKIVRADHDRCLHDHPWGFFGFILKGGYVEDVPTSNPYSSTSNIIHWTGRRTVKPLRFINRLNPHFTHRIHRLLNGPSWTILVRTPSVREWGFYTPEGWLHWRKFLGLKQETRVAWCGTDENES